MATTSANLQTLTEKVLQGTPGGDPSGALINQQQFLSPTSILAPRVFRAALKF